MKIAYSKIKLETDSGDRANDGIAHDEVDPEMQKHLSFTKLLARGLQHSHKSAIITTNSAILLFVLGPFRFITMWLMRQSSEAEDPCKRPSLCDVVNAAHSPFCFTSPYVASLAIGHAPRLIFLVRKAGCEDYAEFCRRHSKRVRLLRRMLLSVAT